jgi:hypothetical protein
MFLDALQSSQYTFVTNKMRIIYVSIIALNVKRGEFAHMLCRRTLASSFLSELLLDWVAAL